MVVILKDFKITFLGTSAASISPRSSTSAILVEVGRTRIIVDAGIGALRQLYKAGVHPDTLDAVLLTHWHFDHWAGLPGLVKSRKHSTPLPVYGPKPPYLIAAYLRATFSAVLKSFLQANRHFSKDFPDVRVESFQTLHTITSIGWSLAESHSGNRKVVISGDTRPVETITKAACGADLLIHEATYLERHSGRAVTHRHSTAFEAGVLAVKSRVGGLALTHTATRYSIQTIRKEAEKIFPGVIVSSPMTTIFIDPQIEKPGEGYGWACLRVSEKK